MLDGSNKMKQFHLQCKNPSKLFQMPMSMTLNVAVLQHEFGQAQLHQLGPDLVIPLHMILLENDIHGPRNLRTSVD
jgi:hypothetical protein